MMSDDDDINEIALIDAIEEISTDKLKEISHRKYIDQLFEISDKALRNDPTGILLLLDAIKSCKEASYKRDLLLDVLNEIFSPDNVLIIAILSNPLPDKYCPNVAKELANAIATIPDLAANCNAQSRISLFTQDSFYRRLLDAIYTSLDVIPKPMGENSRFFFLQMIGRISFSDSGTLLWRNFTLRVINETKDEIKSVASEILRLPLSSAPGYESFELFMDRIYQPMFFYLKPSISSGEKLHSILGDGVENNEHLRYIICDKFIFKSNYNLDRQRQSILLFNIAGYLSSIRRNLEHGTEVVHNHGGEALNKASLLVSTLLETIRQWSSATKSLFRTYEQSRHITTAVIVLFRYALRYDQKSLAEHANEIQSKIASVMPIYLNRASREHRDLAMCLGELLLPKLMDLISVRMGGGSNEKAADTMMNWKFDYTDDILYLQQLFKQDIEVIFQDIPADAGSWPSSTSKIVTQKVARLDKSQSSSSSQSNCRQSRIRGTAASSALDEPVTKASTRMKPIVELLNDNKMTKTECMEDDDLEPYCMRVGGGEGAYDDDGSDYDPETSTITAPIYLRDCIDGLIENNNHRYVRLCLSKAGELIEQLMQDDVDTRDQQMLRGDKWLNETTEIEPSTYDARRMIDKKSKDREISATIRDVGVELARALLFLDNQFNIKGFKDYRMRALTSLCVAAPQLIGKYLIDELNGTNRSMQQQLDILQILMESAERLSTSSTVDLERGEEVGAMSRRRRITEPNQAERRINRFSAHAALYFYGIVYRLKADFVGSRSLVIAQPKSILSAFRELKCQPGKAEEEEEEEGNCHQQAGSLEPRAEPLRATNRLKQLESTIISLKGDIDRDDSANVDRFLERNSLSDDSYLLSRIILATSIVLRCASQQLVLCKLSNDLLEILAAYRCHPDAGVQKSMIAALKAIRHCTPHVYQENFLERRMIELFGPWLASLDELDMQH